MCADLPTGDTPLTLLELTINLFYRYEYEQFGIAIPLCCLSYLLMTVRDNVHYKCKCFVMIHYEEYI